MVYAVTDIETTGGYASANSIIEIAIYIYDGNSIIEEYQSLINPGRSIPRFISSLTGITEEMVQLAPSFEDVAGKIVELLQGKVFVAHNVNFDYSFLKHHLDLCGYNLHCNKLCTVRYSRKIFPRLASYSLGSLCRHFEIPVTNRHRAAGDARATVELLRLLQKRDVNNYLQKMIGRQSKEQYLPIHLNKEDIESLPLTPGVYYFHDEKDKIIYVGKALQLRKRVTSHFSNNNSTRQRQEFLRNIHRITYQQCGTELMASVLETIEIKRLWPKYNRATKGFEASYGMYMYEDGNGYLRLAIDRKHKHIEAVQFFYNQLEGMTELKRIANEFLLCYKLCFIDRSGSETCSSPACNGACKQAEEAVKYNARVMLAIEQMKKELPSFAIRERSYFNNQDACILMENGRFYGMGYVPVDFDIANRGELKKMLRQYPEYQFVRNLVIRYAMEQPVTVNWLGSE
jgi:DNA polymerase-3 subunit epsilon